MFLSLGDLSRARHHAEESMAFSARSGSPREGIEWRARFASIMHQAGAFEEARRAFEEAEHRLQTLEPDTTYLWSLEGFQFCELLLDLGKHEEVERRAQWMLSRAEENLRLRDLALAHLILGRVWSVAAQKGGHDYSTATNHLDEAVDGLRRSGRRDELPRGLLARARWLVTLGSLERALDDLQEAFSIGMDGRMQMVLADYHLTRTRLAIARKEVEEARESLTQAEEVIAAIEYRRRDSEVAELTQRLQSMQP
jgi:tetratricopeptide (TPR) repeat protein